MEFHNLSNSFLQICPIFLLLTLSLISMQTLKSHFFHATPKTGSTSEQKQKCYTNATVHNHNETFLLTLHKHAIRIAYFCQFYAVQIVECLRLQNVCEYLVHYHFVAVVFQILALYQHLLLILYYSVNVIYNLTYCIIL